MATKKKDNGVSEMDRITLYNKQLKIRTLNAQLEAIKQRRGSIAMELQVLPKQEEEAKQQRDALLNEYQNEYTAMKEAAGVPEGHELNLETGEVVQLPQQSQ
jgi:hypothetical protein